MLTTLEICRVANRQSAITMSCTWVMFSGMVAVEGLPGHKSSSRLSLPRLNLAGHFFTVENEGASSPKVETMSACICVKSSPFQLQVFDDCPVASFVNFWLFHWVGSQDDLEQRQ